MDEKKFADYVFLYEERDFRSGRLGLLHPGIHYVYSSDKEVDETELKREIIGILKDNVPVGLVPAGMQRGVLRGAYPMNRMTTEVIDVICYSGANPLQVFPGEGICIWGGRFIDEDRKIQRIIPFGDEWYEGYLVGKFVRNEKFDFLYKLLVQEVEYRVDPNEAVIPRVGFGLSYKHRPADEAVAADSNVHPIINKVYKMPIMDKDRMNPTYDHEFEKTFIEDLTGRLVDDFRMSKLDAERLIRRAIRDHGACVAPFITGER